MATTNDQLAQTYAGFDEVFHNYSTTTDIAAGVAVKLDGTNFIGDALGTTVPGIVLPASGGDPSLCVGITVEKIKFGTNGRVRVFGIASAIADGSITAGATVDASPDSDDLGQVKAHTAGKAQIGIARSGASDLDPVLVFVCPCLDA